jgi:hypothetical protein
MKRSGLGDIWPLSPMQHGMLFHVLYDRGATDVYRGQVVFNLEGPPARPCFAGIPACAPDSGLLSLEIRFR